MNLLFRALLSAVAEAARDRGIERFRVAHKRNGQGELVVALIIDTRGGGPLATIDEEDPRELRRRDRMRR